MTSRSLARCGLCCALLVCSAWTSITFGPVPFTLQTLVLTLLPQILSRNESVMVVVVYVLLGLVGLPVFSNFQAGLAAIMGPTGGFIWGFIVSMVPAATIVHAESLPARLRVPLGAAVLLAICYALGTVQLMAVSGMDVYAALAAAVLPFIVPDVAKAAVSIMLAAAINRATAAVRAH